jgi:hypothetical protein
MIDIYDLDLISPETLRAIVRDEAAAEGDARKINNTKHYARMFSWFDSGVPQTPTIIYEFNQAGDVVPITYEDIKDHPKVRKKRSDCQKRGINKEEGV